MRKHHPEQEEQSVETLRGHFKLIEEQVNNTLTLLFKLPEIARQLKPTDLPSWIPKVPSLVCIVLYCIVLYCIVLYCIVFGLKPFSCTLQYLTLVLAYLSEMLLGATVLLSK